MEWSGRVRFIFGLSGDEAALFCLRDRDVKG